MSGTGPAVSLQSSSKKYRQMTQDYPLTDIRMHDGSRDFLSLPCTQGPDSLWHSLRGLDHVTRNSFVPAITETWMAFTWRGWSIAIHDPYGEYWFFADDPETPDTILQEIRAHFLQAAL